MRTRGVCSELVSQLSRSVLYRNDRELVYRALALEALHCFDVMSRAYASS